MNWAGKKVLVTGAGGFIGSHLVEALVERGARVRALVHYHNDSSWGWLDHSPVRDDVEVVQGDVRAWDSLSLAIQGQEVVYHLAALVSVPYSYGTPQDFMMTNALGSLNVFQVALSMGIERVIFMSSSEVYGSAQQVPMDEQHPTEPSHPYGASKLAADRMAMAMYWTYDLPVVVIRSFNTYGPRQSTRAVVASAITQGLAKGEIRLSNLHSTRDFLHVSDTVAGLMRAAEVPEAVGQVFNLGTGQELAVWQVGEMVAKALGCPDMGVVEDTSAARPEGAEVQRLCADSRKAEKLLDWQAKTPVYQGILMTCEWYRQNLHLYPKAGRHLI